MAKYHQEGQKEPAPEVFARAVRASWIHWDISDKEERYAAMEQTQDWYLREDFVSIGGQLPDEEEVPEPFVPRQKHLRSDKPLQIGRNHHPDQGACPEEAQQGEGLILPTMPTAGIEDPVNKIGGNLLLTTWSGLSPPKEARAEEGKNPLQQGRKDLGHLI